MERFNTDSTTTLFLNWTLCVRMRYTVVCYDHSLSYKFMLSWRFISSAISSLAALLGNERVLCKQNYYHFTPSVARLPLLVTTNETRIQCTLVRVLRLHVRADMLTRALVLGSPTNMVFVWKSPKMICIIKLPVELVYSFSLYISVLNILDLWHAVRLLSMCFTQVYYTLPCIVWKQRWHKMNLYNETTLEYTPNSLLGYDKKFHIFWSSAGKFQNKCQWLNGSWLNG